MLEGPDACKEVFILFQPKVNTGFGNHSVNFVKKAAQVSSVTQASEHVQSLFAFSVASS